MSDAAWHAWGLIVAVAAVVFFTRAVFILPGSRLQLPSALERLLRYAPAAALAAIIAPDIVFLHGEWALSLGNPRLVAGLVALILAAATRNVLLTIVAGMAAFELARYALG